MKFRTIKNKIISLIPSQWLKQIVYKSMGYRIGKNVFIGRSILDCKQVVIEDNVTIHGGNHIAVGNLHLRNGSSILSGNRIVGDSKFTLGSSSRIIYDHYIDVWNNVTIGDHTWLAGKGSQIWTHGSLKTKLGKDLTVEISDNCYLSSSVCIAPGIKIASNVLIGLGSVVISSIKTSHTIVSGNPAVVIKDKVDWRDNW